MYLNLPFFCITRPLNRNNGYLLLAKKKNGVSVSHSFSKCTETISKSWENFIQTKVTKNANEKGQKMWNINRKVDNSNEHIYNSLTISCDLLCEGTKSIKTQTVANTYEFGCFKEDSVTNTDLLAKGRSVVSIEKENSINTTIYLEDAISRKKEESYMKKEEETGSINGKTIMPWIKVHINNYSDLSKLKLTLWITLSSSFGNFMLGGSSPIEFSSLLVGVFLCSCSANTFNQIYEKDLDKLMNRTKKRPLPNNKITLPHANLFGFTTAFVGTLVLYHYNNMLTASLGLLNILLYTLVYTPLKVKTPYNTHIGSIVGSVPTLMGCTSVAPTLLLPEPWILFITQLLWQFPHFYSLAYLHKEDYLKGNYKMFPLKDTNGMYTAKICRPYILTLTMLPFVFFALGYTSYMYMITSLFPNLYIYYKFHNFSKHTSKKNIRSFFKHSLWHIIVLLALSAYHTQVPDRQKKTKDLENNDTEDTLKCGNLYDQGITKFKKRLLKYCVVFS